MSGWRATGCAVIAGLGAAATLSACGSGARQDASEPSGKFSVAVPVAAFPSSQHLSQHTHLVIAVRNDGLQPIPNLAVTICNLSCSSTAPRAEGTSAQAFAEDQNVQYLANPSRPVWVVDQAPGPCNYSCQSGGAGSDATAYSNTWALGKPLKPGSTATFIWAVTAVKPGRHVIAWEVAAGLNGKARAVLSNGGTPQGTFAVMIDSAPQQTYVNNQGRIVSTP
ncbi:MAG: hypothetical protein JO156_04300 [Solirubrobacterales bacterium]|nr:hypothetical protein [Solirubrobacterales bacterium]